MAISVIGAAAAAGASENNFTVAVGVSGNTTYVLDRAYVAGSYKVTFVNNDTSYDIYAIAKDGTSAGYTNSSRLITTKDFNQLSILGAASNERIVFQYEGIASSPLSAGDVSVAGAYVTNISDGTLVAINDSTVITGGNFAPNVAVTFTGTDTVARAAKSIVRSSSTSLIATRPDAMPVSASPYTITVTNPGISAPTGSNVHILANSVTVGGTPVWVTTALTGFNTGSPYTFTLQATDVDGAVAYSIVSGTLQAGLSLNQATGVISGTPTVGTFVSLTFRATDTAGNFLDRTFTLGPIITISGGTLTSDATFYYRTFTANGTLGVAGGAITADILVVAGGGGGAGAHSGISGGGGGAGGYRTSSGSLGINTYPVVVGAGGAGGASGSSAAIGSNGSTSSINSILTSGGGAARAYSNGNGDSSSGGSGGGGNWNTVAAGLGNAGGYSPVEGFNGANGGQDDNAQGNGGGATAAGTRGGGGTGGTWINGSVYATGGRSPSRYEFGNASAFPAGPANTGNGGGGANHAGSGGGPGGTSGGSGIVIVRYTRVSVGG